MRAFLTVALETLYTEERIIIAPEVAERTIGAQPAAIVKRNLPDHAVHVEYNRHGIAPKEIEMPEADGALTIA